MFCEFEQGTKKSQDCTSDCKSHEYLLQARYHTHTYHSVYSIEEEVIVTSMIRFYQSVRISALSENGDRVYHGSIFVGVSFKDNNGIIVKTNEETYILNVKDEKPALSSTVCGTETEASSGWMSVGGPIKGSYVVKDGTDDIYDYISDFGMQVQDPCKAFDNKLNINLNPTNRTFKDLKYHDGTDSQFWLPKVC